MKRSDPSVAIVTVSFNSADTIGRTIESVNGQTYPNITHVFVDGGSTDSTRQTIEAVSTRRRQVLVGNDMGPYDAMNKGIRAAEADIIGILNSDDYFTDPGSIAHIVEAFCSTDAEVVYGDIEIFDRRDPGHVLRLWKTGRFSPKAFRRGWHPPHPGFYATKTAYDHCGLYRTDLRVSADFELMLRMLERCRLPSAYLPKVVVRMASGGISNRSLRNIVLGNWNCLRAFSLNRFSLPLVYPLRRLGVKTTQLLRARNGVACTGE